jgi:hypothetical protein
VKYFFIGAFASLTLIITVPLGVKVYRTELNLKVPFNLRLRFEKMIEPKDFLDFTELPLDKPWLSFTAHRRNPVSKEICLH